MKFGDWIDLYCNLYLRTIFGAKYLAYISSSIEIDKFMVHDFKLCKIKMDLVLEEIDIFVIIYDTKT